MPSSPQRLCGADQLSSTLHFASPAMNPAVRPARRWQQWLTAVAFACLPLGAQAADDAPAADTALSASAIQAIESEVGARIGVTVLDTADGTRFSWRGDERFPMSSTFKVLACGHLLSRVDEGQESLSRKVEIHPADLVTYSPITEHHTQDGGLTLEA